MGVGDTVTVIRVSTDTKLTH
eukprot:COSAG06_NODE_67621_length_251_cov_0.986842_1_plen_20_part_01